MKLKVLIFYFLQIALSCNYTNTPKEYLYNDITPKAAHISDKIILTDELTYGLSRDFGLLPKSDGLEYIEHIIDTIFYGPDSKLAFLHIAKRRNDLLSHLPREHPDQVEYYASSFICTRRSHDSIEIVNDLMFHYSQGETLREATNAIRKIYFNELQLVKSKNYYNINDTRFWDSGIWKYPDGRPVFLSEE